MNKIVEKFENYPKRSIFILVLLPLLIIPALFYLFKAALLIITLFPDSLIALKVDVNEFVLGIDDYFNFYINLLGITFTVIFSYVVWQSSEKSYKLAKEIKDKEDRRDSEITRENALIVYYDILIGLNDLKSLYLSMKRNKMSLQPKRLYFSNEWIKNVALLNDVLTQEQIRLIYLLYGDFHTIKGYLENKVPYESVMKDMIPNCYVYDDDIYACIQELVDNIFVLSELSKQSENSENPNNIEPALKGDYQRILARLRTKMNYQISISQGMEE